MHTCERDFKMSSSATVMSSVSGGSPDPPGGMGHRARHQRRGAGLEAYSCLCGSFILVLVTLLVVFVVGIIRSSMSEDGYEMGNMVFMALCIAIIVMLIVTSLACLCMCQKHSNSPDPEGGVHTKTGSSRGGAYYIVGWDMKILKQSGTDCPICWERMDSKQQLKAKLVCQHVFHHHCWQNYSKMTTAPAVCCPLCRATPIKFPGVERLKSDVKILVDRFRCFKRNDFPPDGDTRVAMIDV